jgi:hypothetical protein
MIVFDLYKKDKCEKCIRQSKCCCSYLEMIMCSQYNFFKGRSQSEECKNDPEYSDIDMKRMKKARGER